MNGFAALLLAFPFYLALKGELSAYVAFAKPGAPASANVTGSNVASTSNASEAGASGGAANAASATGGGSDSTLANAANFMAIAGMFVS